MHACTWRTPCKEEGRDWGHVLQAKEHCRLLTDHEKLGEKHGTDFSSQTLENINAVDIFILDF
jgi:hypothetical protein